MKRGTKDKKAESAAIANLDALTTQIRRINYMNSLVSLTGSLGPGKSYGGDRDLYSALGYNLKPEYKDYVNISARDGFGKRVNEAPCDAVWSKPPEIMDSKEGAPSKFEQDFKKLARKFNLWASFNRLDKLLGFGPYAVMLCGFNDTGLSGYKSPVRKGAELIYLQCYPSEYARISSLVTDPKDPRYGLPKTYSILALDPNELEEIGVSVSKIVEDGGQVGRSFEVHYSRILHVLEGNLSNPILGEPRLKVCYNCLEDIAKVVGGAAEMFWRGARPGYQAKLDEDFNWDPGGDDPSLKAVRTQLDEFEHNLRRILTLRGVSVDSLAMQVANNPKDYLDMQIESLAAASRIPKRVLTGSERGELASSQDRDSWIEVVDDRRKWYGSPVFIRPFINMMIEVGMLSPPENDEYEIIWPDLKAQSEKDRADIGNTRSNALRNYVTSIGADQVIPIEGFIRYFLGLDESTSSDLITQLKMYLEGSVEGDIRLSPDKYPATVAGAEPPPQSSGTRPSSKQVKNPAPQGGRPPDAT